MTNDLPSDRRLPRSEAALSAVLDRQARLADALVLGEPIPLAAIDREVEAIREELLDRHIARADGPTVGARSDRESSDHGRFVESIAQLEWYGAIVRGDDQGGHRQALGQYWRILLESVRWHLDEESAGLRRAGRTEREAPGSPRAAPPER